MSIHKIITDTQLFDQRIYQEIIDPSGTSLPVMDGIVNPEKFLSAKHKILWILKEVNDPEYHEEYGGKRGGWSMRDFISDNFGNYTYWRRTYAPITYTTWSILNGFCSWNETPEFSIEQASDLLEHIAYINLKKLPGLAQSNWKEIKAAYEANKSLILAQINSINPDIIIGGGTLHYLYDDLGLPYGEMETNGSMIKNGGLYVSVEHPNQKKLKGEIYFNNIVVPAKDWANKTTRVV